MGKVLVFTTSNERNVTRVLQLLKPRQYLRVDTDDILKFEILFKAENGTIRWALRTPKGQINSTEINAIWYRRPKKLVAVEELTGQEQQFAENEINKSVKSLLSTINGTNVYWMNHPRSLWEFEYNKPLQEMIAAEVGFRVPATLITNKKDEVLNFFDKHKGEVIIKTFGGTSLEDENGKPIVIYTNRLKRKDIELFGDEIRYCPVMLQNYIPKKLELRITVVGRSCFTCAIYSQSSDITRDDWRRYDPDKVRHEPWELPPEINDKILAFMDQAHLTFAAIDLILTPEGEFVWLEANPNGQWQWIEFLTGLPIDQAIADLLLNPPKN